MVFTYGQYVLIFSRSLVFGEHRTYLLKLAAHISTKHLHAFIALLQVRMHMPVAWECIKNVLLFYYTKYYTNWKKKLDVFFADMLNKFCHMLIYMSVFCTLLWNGSSRPRGWNWSSLKWRDVTIRYRYGHFVLRRFYLFIFFCLCIHSHLVFGENCS